MGTTLKQAYMLFELKACRKDLTKKVKLLLKHSAFCRCWIVQLKPNQTPNIVVSMGLLFQLAVMHSVILFMSMPGSKAMVADEKLPASGDANNSEQQLHDTGLYY